MLLWKRSLVAATLACGVFLVGCGKETISNAPTAGNVSPKDVKTPKGSERKYDMPKPPPAPPPPPPPSGDNK